MGNILFNFDDYTLGTVVGQKSGGGSTGSGVWAAIPIESGGSTQVAPTIIDTHPAIGGRGKVLKVTQTPYGNSINWTGQGQFARFTPDASLYYQGDDVTNPLITVQFDLWRPNSQTKFDIRSSYTLSSAVLAGNAPATAKADAVFKPVSYGDAHNVIVPQVWQTVQITIDLVDLVMLSIVGGIPAVNSVGETYGTIHLGTFDPVTFPEICLGLWGYSKCPNGESYFLVDNLILGAVPKYRTLTPPLRKTDWAVKFYGGGEPSLIGTTF